MRNPRPFRRHRRVRVRPISGLTINRMIPNILTLLALCAGMTAIRFAILGKFEAAVGSLILAALLDGLDARLPRPPTLPSLFASKPHPPSHFLSSTSPPP